MVLRILLLSGWLLVPVAGLAWHMGPGQERKALDEVAKRLRAAEARSTLANSQYYMTWLMRLEGMSPNDWEPEIEAARQSYKLLAEDAQRRGDATAEKKRREDLESAIRLARMELGELQGLPLPSQ